MNIAGGDGYYCADEGVDVPGDGDGDGYALWSFLLDQPEDNNGCGDGSTVYPSYGWSTGDGCGDGYGPVFVCNDWPSEYTVSALTFAWAISSGGLRVRYIHTRVNL